MSTLTLQIGDSTYDIACGEDQELHLKTLAAAINKRMRDQLKQFSGTRSEIPPENYLWLLTALSQQEEIRELQDELTVLRRQSEARIRSMEGDAERAYAQGLEQAYDAVSHRLEKLAMQV